MNYSELSRAMLMNFIGAFIITVMVWFFLATLQNEYLPYVATFLGMYVFAAFGINRIVDEKTIPNNYWRFILAIICIVIFSVAFLFIMPMIFGPNVFPNPFVLNYNGSDIIFNNEMILAICGLIILVVNFLDYR